MATMIYQLHTLIISPPPILFNIAIRSTISYLSVMIDDTYARELPDGTIEIVSTETGEVVEERVSFETAYLSRTSQGLTRNLSYSHHLGDIVCQRIADGVKISDIAKAPGFPTASTIARWTMQHPLFKMKFKMARRAIAMKCAEKMLDVAEVDLEKGTVGYIQKDEAPGKKIQMDTLKWLAEKSDSEFFTTKHVTHHGDEEKPIKFIIETGIDRSAGKVVDAHCEEVSDVDPIERDKEIGWEGDSLPQRQSETDGVSESEKGKEDCHK